MNTWTPPDGLSSDLETALAEVGLDADAQCIRAGGDPSRVRSEADVVTVLVDLERQDRARETVIG